MKKVAILSDIHANIPALEAVWNDLTKQRVDEVYHLGDLVGYNPYPAEAIQFVRENRIPGLVGNYDMAVAGDEPDPVSTYLKPSISPAGRAAYEWTAERVSAEDRAFLLSLPHRIDLTLNGRRATLVHGSPDSIREYLLPDVPEDRFNELFDSSRFDIMLCGHTHIPMIRRFNGGVVINPGSVGKPKDGDPRASYLILHCNGDVEPELRRVDYPVADVADMIRKCGLPEKQAVSLEKGASA